MLIEKIHKLTSSCNNKTHIVPHLAKLDQISKQYIYQDNQVLSLGRVSLSFTSSNLKHLEEQPAPHITNISRQGK